MMPFRIPKSIPPPSYYLWDRDSTVEELIAYCIYLKRELALAEQAIAGLKSISISQPKKEPAAVELGHKRAASMSPDQHTKSAKKAAHTRWSKPKEVKTSGQQNVNGD